MFWFWRSQQECLRTFRNSNKYSSSFPFISCPQIQFVRNNFTIFTAPNIVGKCNQCFLSKYLSQNWFLESKIKEYLSSTLRYSGFKDLILRAFTICLKRVGCCRGIKKIERQEEIGGKDQMEKFILQFMAVILHIVIVTTGNSLCEQITSQFTSAFVTLVE